jgi:pyruvate dehydrogenase E2 component (dihydrolipoamide acetyltransferase)
MPETIEVRVPNIGDFAEVPVIEVLVKPGDVVAVEDPLVTLESEKATMDVPSPLAGTVQSVAVHVGDKVSEGVMLLALAPAGAAAPAAAPPPEASPQEAAAPEAAAPETSAPKPALAPSSAPEVADPSPPPAASANGAVHASPAIRRFARELGVALGEVRGSGPHERVTREDVQAFVQRSLAEKAAAPAAAGAGLDLLPWPKVDFARFGPIERVPLSRIRKLSGPNLQRNWVMIPHVTNHDEADITELEAFRKTLNAENQGAKVTMLAFVILAVVAALKAFPEVNSSLDGDALVLKRYYNIGFAADTPGGLVVPVLKAADTKGVLAIAAETAALAAKARDGKLALGDMQGATFTISSLGGIGGTAFTPIINAPEVAILGVSRSVERPVWNGTAFVPRLLLPLSLSYDHRVIDGALAARFNVALTRVLADLRRAML